MEKVIKRGESLHSSLFSLKYLKNQLTRARIAVVIAKKEEKTAVGRNYIRRRLREALKITLKNQAISADLVIFAKKNCQKEDFKGLVYELTTILSRLK